MGFISLLSLILAATSTVFCAPADQLRRTATTAITGVKGSVQPRLEIRTLAQNADQWNIFLLGLAQFQAVSYTSALSYYQIAGIHGANWGSWDGAAECSGCGGGYCTHSMTLFPTWHRPYLALFEQQLVANAVAVANTFTGTNKSKYVNATSTLRLPYWDWAVNAPDVFPSFFTTPTINVTAPTGKKTIANPLYAYTFPKGAAQLGSPFNTTTTVRYPPSSGSSTSQESQVVSAMAGQQPGLKSTMWQLFSQQNVWDYFSTEMWESDGGPSSYSNLESPHDDVHATVGGPNGHMSYIGVAAFDPVFWFHHAMVDRSFALWQTLYPAAYFDTVTEASGTYAIAANSVVSNKTALSPFHTDTTGDSWTSAGAWGTTELGYTYPELQNGASIASVSNAITALYSPNSTITASKRDNDATVAVATTQEYIANIRADRMSLGNSFRVFIFDGTPNDADPAAYINATNLIASHAFFAALGASSGPSMPATATLSLTSALQSAVSAGRLSSTSVDAVSTYLADVITWRITLLDGTLILPAALPGLLMSVVTATVTLPATSAELPSWGPFTVLEDVTRGKAGGANSTVT